MELSLHRNRCRDVTALVMIDKMLGLAVLPISRMNGKRFSAERIWICLAELSEGDLRQSVEPADFGRGDTAGQAREAGKIEMLTEPMHAPL